MSDGHEEREQKERERQQREREDHRDAVEPGFEDQWQPERRDS
ncbi:hypothetical protein [Terriglobus aquaticus]|nr:hypothetical protein [Terriglobus aquaticus]